MDNGMNEFQRRLYVAAQVREMDRRAIDDAGIPGYTLMQRAAAATFRVLGDRWPHARTIGVLCGSGNNGGDGFEIARLARAAGLSVRVWQFGMPAATGDAARARQAWFADGGTVAVWPDESGALAHVDVVVDAIFGTGLSRPPAADVMEAIAAVASARAAGSGVLAVDIPSGLAADSGAVLGAAMTADVTVTFIGNKIGLHLGEGPERCGSIVFDGLGAPMERFADLQPRARLMSDRDLDAVLPPRRRSSHKGDNGHVLIVGGDHGMAGAVLLAARGAMRAGAGLVTVATRAEHTAALTAAQPEIMFRAVSRAEDLAPLLARADVVAIGPGLGQAEWGRSLWAAASGFERLVVDADALNLLAQAPLRNDGWVLTPHPGEAARLLGSDGRAVQADRIAAVCSLRERFGGVAVLKGAGTLVAGATPALCRYGNPGMGVGGMGDVLCGIIAGLRAQGLDAETAACAGVLAHARAGDRAALGGERGMMASDLLAELRGVVNPA
jgi:NAD(P)H-hydrate epimerase